MLVSQTRPKIREATDQRQSTKEDGDVYFPSDRHFITRGFAFWNRSTFFTPYIGKFGGPAGLQVEYFYISKPNIFTSVWRASALRASSSLVAAPAKHASTSRRRSLLDPEK